jgi:hypothetical protein
MKASDFGIDGGWGGIRTTSALINKFTAAGIESVVVARQKAIQPVTRKYMFPVTIRDGTRPVLPT